MKKHYKLLTFQPYSLFGGGGGSRILRRLFEGHEKEIFSICVGESNSQGEIITEVSLPFKPALKKWHRWLIRTFIIWVRNNIWVWFAAPKFRKIAESVSFDILHIVDHGPFSNILCNEANIRDKEIWVSFHDYFTTSKGKMENTRILWQVAARRFVISEEMGVQYQKLFGIRDYRVVTDGLYLTEISNPSVKAEEIITVYFSGLVHIDYLPLFKGLTDAMDLLVEEGVKIRLLLRGAQKINFLNDRNFLVEYLPFTLDNSELKKELDQASILYLPVKFSQKDFYLYSLSTKMVGYLGGAGVILYHGPADSAACNLLKKHNASICCYSLSPGDLKEAIKVCLKNGRKISADAKQLAMNKFDMNSIREKFWAYN
jgi:hypothetical protein